MGNIICRVNLRLYIVLDNTKDLGVRRFSSMFCRNVTLPRCKSQDLFVVCRFETNRAHTVWAEVHLRPGFGFHPSQGRKNLLAHWSPSCLSRATWIFNESLLHRSAVTIRLQYISILDLNPGTQRSLFGLYSLEYLCLFMEKEGAVPVAGNNSCDGVVCITNTQSSASVNNKSLWEQFSAIQNKTGSN